MNCLGQRNFHLVKYMTMCITTFLLVHRSDAQSCTPPTLSAVIEATCESASNGSIDLTVHGTGSYTYMWSPGGATTQDISGISDGLYEVVVTIDGDPLCTVSAGYIVGENAEPFANAGLDKGQCENGNFTMTAVSTSIGTGTWSFVGPTNGASISEPNNPTTLITNLNVGSSATLAWTIVNINCSDQDEVTITNSTEVLADAGLNQEKCNEGDFIMSATPPSLGSGSWSIVGLPNGANIINSALHNTQVTGLNPGTSVTLRWVVNNGTCFDTDDVILTNNTPVSAVAGSNNTQCNNGTFQLQALDPFVGTGAWSIIGDTHGASIINNNSHDAMVSGLAAGQTITLRWRVTNGGCTASDDILLTNQLMVIADAGDDLKNCNNGVFTLAAEMPSVGSGSWSIIGPPGGAVVLSPSSPTSQVVGLTNGSTVTLRWSVFNGTCFSMDQVTLFNDVEVFTLVGPNQVKCNHGTFDLIANTPTIGVGTWTFVSPPISATIDNINSPTAQVSGVQAGETASLRWTITNGGCSDYKELTLTNDQMVDADAGPDIYQCENGDFTMAANSPLVTGAGFWEILGAPNGASIANPTDPSTAVNGLNIDRSATLKWTLTNGTCIDSDTIKIFHSAPVSSHAGSNQQKCTTGSFTLEANDPVLGIGEWSFIGEKYNAVIDDITAYNANVTGLELTQQVTLRWTVTNGGCQVYEDVMLTNDPEVMADAGTNIENCNNGNFTLSAVDPIEGFGVWSIVGDAHGAIIDNVSLYNSEVFGLELGQSVMLRWYVTNGGCEAEDFITLTNYQGVVASPGDNQVQCNNGDFTLAALPSSVGSGIWTIVGASNGASISNPTLHSSSVTGLSAGSSVTLRWNLVNGPCSDSDDITLTNDRSVSALAGPNQSQCDSGTYTLAANDPMVGTGVWAIIGNAHGATISDISKHNATVNNVPPGQSISLRWSVTNGTCSDDDTVTLTNHSSVMADAGPNQQQCNNGTFQLNAISPSIGSGTWSIIGNANGASINSSTSHQAIISGLTQGNSVTLRWTVTNGTCSDTDDIILTNDELVMAQASSNQVQCNSGVFTLSGNSTTVGSGLWTIIGPNHGATISDPTAHTTTISGLSAGQSVTLRWTISNGTCTSSDDVSLVNDLPILAEAGPDQRDCNNAAFTLAGNQPSQGVGVWTIVGMSHGAVITDLNLYNTTVTDLQVGQSVVLRWTITNGTCEFSDDLTLTNDRLVISEAGPDQTLCNQGTFVLSAHMPNVGTGMWTILGDAKSASLEDATAHNTTISNVAANQALTLRWTVTNQSCSSTDIVIITNDAPVIAIAGDDQEQCNDGSFLMNATDPSIGQGTWSIVGEAYGATIDNENLHNTSISGLQTDQSITVRWTVSNGLCSLSDDVTLTNHMDVNANAGPNITQCNNGSFSLTANDPSVGSGLWSFVGESSGAQIVNKNNASTTVTGLLINKSATLRWTVNNGKCTSTDEVTITNDLSSVACPDNQTIMACQTQSHVDERFSLWISSFEAVTNATGNISYVVTVDDSPALNLSSLSGITSPDSSGGKVTITISAQCASELLTCQSSFEVAEPEGLHSFAPAPIDKPACSDSDEFNNWKNSFTAMGECASMITYDVNIINNLEGSDPLGSGSGETDTIKLRGITDISEIEPPSSCGGSIEILIRIRSSYGFHAGLFDEQTSSSSYKIQSSTPVTVYGPLDFETEEMATQTVIDQQFEEWIMEFGYIGGICGNLEETDLSKYTPPSYMSGTTTIRYVAEDQCSLDTIESTFSVPPFALVPKKISIQGPQVVCGNTDGYTYQVDTIENVEDLNIAWSYRGIGGVILEQIDNTIDMGFLSTFTEGYLVATVSNNFNLVSDSIYINMENPRVCQTYCRGLLDISDFMMNNGSMPDSIDYWAEFSIFSTGRIRSSGTITFNAGLSIELQEEFSVEKGGVLEINIDHCDGIGIRDSDGAKIK